MAEQTTETAQHTFTRPIANGTTYTATVSEAPGHPGYIEVTTDMALSLLAQAGRDGVVEESLPGVVMFTVADLTDLLTSTGWECANA